VAHRISITFVPTAMAERLITLPWPRDTALRIMLTGADTLHVYPSAHLPFVLVNNYGPTECTVVATSGPVLPNQDSGVLPAIGWPIMNTEILILDPQMRPVRAGEVGELYIGGICLARGYRNRPDLTAASFVHDPRASDANARLYKTGDLGRYLPDGQIAFLGRRDGQIKIRGFRVEPDEITAVLDRHHAIQSSVVVGYTNNDEERQLVAYIVAAPGQELTATALRSHLAKSLPEYMVPSIFVRLTSIPTTMNGKVDRTLLPPPNSSNMLRTKSAEASDGTVERHLTTIVSDLLKLDNIGGEENFFLMGGHSLLGMQLMTKIQDTFDVELSLVTLFERPTIRELASEIERLVLECQKVEQTCSRSDVP
jgi:acyl-CoA synthetase (AMP-forming)/AMP-acid ligase II/acyl carrier protein